MSNSDAENFLSLLLKAKTALESDAPPVHRLNQACIELSLALVIIHKRASLSMALNGLLHACRNITDDAHAQRNINQILPSLARLIEKVESVIDGRHGLDDW